MRRLAASVLLLVTTATALDDRAEVASQPKGEICAATTKGKSCALPKNCAALSATGTDPEMKWYCQSPTKQPTTYRHYTDCTDEHVVCTPAASERPPSGAQQAQQQEGSASGSGSAASAAQQATRAPAQKQLVVFLPGTGLVPQDYSEVVADFAGHGFHAIGLMYPSTQGQVSCAMSRVPHPTDLNCTARERYRVLTGSNFSYVSKHPMS